jgi:hypothetical protein
MTFVIASARFSQITYTTLPKVSHLCSCLFPIFLLWILQCFSYFVKQSNAHRPISHCISKSSHIGCTKEIYRPSTPNLQISQNNARLTPLENESQLLFKMQANGGTRKERVHKNTHKHTNVRGEPGFRVTAAGWFCEKSGWIGKVEDVKPVLFKNKTDFNWQPFWGGGFLPG